MRLILGGSLAMLVLAGGLVGATDEEVFRLTAEHLLLLRHAVVVWDPSEVGGPVLIFGKNLDDPLRDVAAVLGERDPAGPTPSRRAGLETLVSELGPALEIALVCGELAPGDYSYRNEWWRAFGREQWPRSANDDGTIRIPVGDTATFRLLPEHLALLRAANAGWLSYAQCPGINSKRPYGDMTCHYLDMAAILGIAKAHPEAESCEEVFAASDLTRMDELHYAMAFALQVFLEHAVIAPGTYRRQSAGSAPWRLEN